MIKSLVRPAVVCCGVVGAMLTSPAESKAIFHWFGGGCCGARTTYVPIAPAVNCNPCQTQVAQYVPTTAYRQECVAVPVTTYRPSVSCDPCSGCPITTLRPVVSYQQQVRMVPYTTYRLVYSNPAPCATGCGTTAPASTYYYPSTTSYAAPSTGSCCTPTSYTAPAASYSQPSYTQPGVTTQPSLPSTTTPPATYDSARPIESPSTDNLQPIPQENGGGTTNGAGSNDTSYGPRFVPPAASRATSAPVQRNWMVRPVSGSTSPNAQSVPAWLQTQRATPAANDNTANVDAWRPSVR